MNGFVLSCRLSLNCCSTSLSFSFPRPIINPRLKRPSSSTGCAWNPSPWCGCPFCTEWLPRKLPSTRPSVTSARSVQSLDSGTGLRRNHLTVSHVFRTRSFASRLRLPCWFAVSLFLSKAGEKVMQPKHRSRLASPWSQGYFGGPDSLGRCLLPPSLSSSSQPHCGWGETEYLSLQRYLFVKGIQMNCASSFLELKPFYPCFLFFMASSVYRNSPGISYKTKSCFYSGKTHPGSSVSFSLGSTSFYPLSNKNYSRHPRTFFFSFESDSLLSIVSWWNPKGIEGRQANEIHKAAKSRKHSL